MSRKVEPELEKRHEMYIEAVTTYVRCKRGERFCSYYPMSHDAEHWFELLNVLERCFPTIDLEVGRLLNPGSARKVRLWLR